MIITNGDTPKRKRKNFNMLSNLKFNYEILQFLNMQLWLDISNINRFIKTLKKT